MGQCNVEESIRSRGPVPENSAPHAEIKFRFVHPLGIADNTSARRRDPKLARNAASRKVRVTFVGSLTDTHLIVRCARIQFVFRAERPTLASG